MAGALRSANVPVPELEMVSLAASAGQWCLPADAPSGKIEFDVSAVTREKPTTLRTVPANVDSFSAPNVPFKTADEATQFIMKYHFTPRPALLVPAIRLIPAEHQADPNLQQFFVSAFRDNPQAAALIGPQIAACPTPTKLLLLSLLAKADVSLSYSACAQSAGGRCCGSRASALRSLRRNAESRALVEAGSVVGGVFCNRPGRAGASRRTVSCLAKGLRRLHGDAQRGTTSHGIDGIHRAQSHFFSRWLVPRFIPAK